MARKSLSSQVLEEVDRIRGNLGPLTEITDPMTAHIVGEGLEGLRRIETMCLAAHQRQANVIVSDTPLGEAFGNDSLARARHKAGTGTKRVTRGKGSAK